MLQRQGWEGARALGGRRVEPEVEPRFLRLAEVATILNVRVAQVYALVRSGSLPAVKLGGRGVWRVDRQRLDAYIKQLHSETRAWVLAHPLKPGERPELD